MLCWHCFCEKNTYDPCPFCGYDNNSQTGRYPLALQPGSILNGCYIVGRVLGQGGFGITYIACDDRTKQRFAIKEYFPTEFAGRTIGKPFVHCLSENLREYFDYGKAQFLEEARTLASFNGSEYVVRVHCYFEENNTAYYVMDYIEGMMLNRYVTQSGGRLSEEEAKRLLLPLMGALQEIHARGLIHRDIAPDNILIAASGTAKLIDFGAARYSTGEKSKSLDVILKHGYAPYEQYMRHGRQGPWTDVYAFAATYYYAVTGSIPPEAVERREKDTLIPPSSLGVQISTPTEKALLKALSVSVNNRYQSMEQFHRAMLGEAQGQQEDTDNKEIALTGSAKRKTEPVRIAFLVLLAAGLILLGVRFAVPALVYRNGETQVEAGRIRQAFASFRSLKDYRDASERAQNIAKQLRLAQCAPLAAGNAHTVALSTVGTVLAAGDNASEQCEVSKWKDIVSLAAGHRHTVGLHADGTVIATGWDVDGRCRTSGWSDIIAISAGSTHTVGLKADGTVVATGFNGERQCEVSDWSDIIAVSAGGAHTVGLRSDGTVVAVGGNDYRQCEVSGWTDIIAVSAGYFHTVGLKADGTVMAVGNNDLGQCNLSEWRDITSIEAGNWQTIGIRTNHTLVAVGQNTDGQCDVSDWSGIVAASTGGPHTVALRTDGTVAAAGSDDFGQCDVSDWRNIRHP